MSWFERITGFPERSYEDTRRRLVVEGDRLHALANGRSYGVGQLELVSLATLRARAASQARPAARLQVRIVRGDVRAMHRDKANEGALFQVASQFNLLEMIAPHVTPEDGVTRYQDDPTQGPACAMAAGAATIYRNYLVPLAGDTGQTVHRQLDGLEDLGTMLSAALGLPVAALWELRNGYALCNRTGLELIATHLASLTQDSVDILKGQLRIGVHSDVEVTDVEDAPRPLVSQAFCSALPVAYSRIEPDCWAPFATLVLEAAYEATVRAAAVNAQRGRSNVLLLTRLGGGAFGNKGEWIYPAIRRALHKACDCALDVRLVGHGAPTAEMLQLVAEFQ